MKCPECYSDDPRKTPLIEPEHCLRNHRQYICSTCGRHVCISTKGQRARCWMPFGTLESAVLYLKCAEILSGGLCGIYRIADRKSGRVSYKIYPGQDDLIAYLKSNPQKECADLQPLYLSPEYRPVKEEQIKMLSEAEVKAYMDEKMKFVNTLTFILGGPL